MVLGGKLTFINKLLLAILAAGILAGCASRTPPPPLMSPYGPGAPYGYVDEKISDDTYRITFVGPRISTATQRSAREKDSTMAKAQASELARWRAAQLAVNASMPRFIVDHEEVETEVVETRSFYPIYHPFYSFGYGSRYSYGGHYYGGPYYPPYYHYSPRFETTLRAIVKLEVRLVDGRVGGSIDAANYASGMEMKYPQGGAAANGGY